MARLILYYQHKNRNYLSK